MTDQGQKRDPVGDLLEDLLAEEEIERDLARSAEERREALKAGGLDPERAHARAREVLAKAGFAATTPATAEPEKPGPPRVVSLAAEREKRRRPSWSFLLVAAAAALVVLGGGGAIIAYNTPGPQPTTPVPSVPTAPPGPTPEQLAQQSHDKAEDLRRQARAAFEAEQWADCRTELQQAKELDPAGAADRSLRRLDAWAERNQIQALLESKGAPAARVLRREAKGDLLARLAPSSGQALRLTCTQAPEPLALCGQLVAAFKEAGWTVTRASIPPKDAPFGMRIEVATDASDAAQDAADALAAGLERANLFAQGPLDLPAGSEAPLRLTVGK